MPKKPGPPFPLAPREGCAVALHSSQERLGYPPKLPVMKTTLPILVTALTMSLAPAVSLKAQDQGPQMSSSGGGDSQRRGGGQGQRPGGGLHLVPPRVQERLNLTEDQKKQITELEGDVKSKMEKILTPDQMNQLQQMRAGGGNRGGGQGGNREEGGGAPEGGSPNNPPPPPPQ